VVLDLRSTDPELAKGLTYFASGFTFGHGGAMRALAEGVYLLIPRDVQVSAEETARLRESLLS
jgi:cell division inhibitor SepF